MTKTIHKFLQYVGIAMGLLVFYFASGCSEGLNRHKSPTTIDDPLPAALIRDLEGYVRVVMKRNDVPGLAMVLVHGDQVIYNQGFGVRDLQSKQAVDSKTLFGIGSSTKPITAVMIASLVDEGIFNWDTKIREILPTFSLSNPNISEELTVEDTLCMCTGIPRWMEQISVQYQEMTPEDIIESLADIRLSGTFRHTFNYSSRMLAAGGYLSAMAAGGEYGNLGQAYIDLVQEKVLDPLGMSSSTFSIAQALDSGNYATPYYSSLSGQEAISPQIEGIFTPIVPAGAMWSNAEDMAKFLMMVLKGGISVEGHRVVSPGTLAYLFRKRVAVDSSTGYSLGWYIEDYHGLTVYHHPGGTVGFSSELVVIPELQLGFVLLNNQLDQVSPIGRMATYRLLEILTGQQQVYDQEIRKKTREINWQVFQLSLITRSKIKPDRIAPFLGAYHNDTLGEVNLRLHEDNSLWVDFGEYESSIRPLILEENQFIFFESVFIGKTISLVMDSDGSPTMHWQGDEAAYTFRR